MSEENITKPVELIITGVSVIAHYGNVKDFATIDAAISFIRELSQVSDDKTPLLYIKAQMEFQGNQFASVSFTSPELVIAWLKQGVFKS